MNLCHKRKTLLLVIAFCIVFSALSAENFIAGSLDHGCVDSGCKPCLRIEIARNFLKVLNMGSILLLVIALCFGLSAENPKKNIAFNDSFVSPVMLKVRLNS